MRTYGSLTHLPADGNGRPRPLWRIEAEPSVMMRLKRIFPKLMTNQQGAQVLSDTPELCRDLEWVMERYPLATSARHRWHLRKRAADHRAQEQTVASILSGRREPLPLREVARVVDGEKQRPYPEQLQAADLILSTGRVLLGDDVGYGKSLSSALIFREPRALPGVVVAPSHLTRQWIAEINDWLPWLRTHLIRASRIYDVCRHNRRQVPAPDVYVITYTMLWGWADLFAAECNSVIFDEMQDLRALDTRKREAAIQVARAVDYRAGCSASPVYNYGGEAHNVISVLDDDILGDRKEFVREWCGADRGDKTAVNDPAALGRYLQESGILLRRQRQKGPPVRIPHLIDADPDEIERLTEDAVDLAELLLSKTSSRQERFMAAGDLDWKLRQATGISKAPYVAAFVRMLLESVDKVVLWGWHRAVYATWLDRLAAFHPVLYTGSESPAAKQRSKEMFLEPLERDSQGHVDPLNARVLVMSLRSGTGLDGLQKVCNVGVFGELDWSPKIHDQALGRLDPTRGLDPSIDATQIPAALGYFLFTDHGSDPVLMDVLNVKRMQAEPIMDPDADLFATAPDTSDRVRRLAEQVLARRGRKPRSQGDLALEVQSRANVVRLADRR